MLLISGKGKQLQTRNDLAKQGISEKNKELINILPPIIKPSASAKGKQRVFVEKNKKPTKQLAIKPSRQESTQYLPNRSKTVKEIAEDRLAEAPVDIDNKSCCGTVYVRFNHYNSAFPIHNGVLKWESVDEKYSISFVYRGNYVRNLEYVSVNTSQPNLRPRSDDSEARYAIRDDMGMYFIDLLNDDHFILHLEEDPVAGIGAEGLRIHKPRGDPGSGTSSTAASGGSSSSMCGGGSSGAGQGGCSLRHGNRAVSLLTSDLKAIKPSDLNSAEAKDLLERRDLEDILYS